LLSGSHIGDWEMVQIRLDHQLVPQDVTYAQHSGGENCDFDYVNDQSNPSRPVVFVADGSHAAYTFSGETDRSTGDDHHWGDGLTVNDLSLVHVSGELHNFWGWPGRWGQDDSGFGKSPVAPMRQGSWKDPHSFDLGADECRIGLHAARAGGTRKRIPSRGLPWVKMTASRMHGRVRVRYRIKGKLPRTRPLYLRLVVHTASKRDMPTSRYIQIRGRRGTTRLRAPLNASAYSVNASVYDRRNRRGRIATVPLD
jgi:hypothetical protein